MPTRRRFPGEALAPRDRRRPGRARASASPSQTSASPSRASAPPKFYRLVYRVVRRIPRGQVATYGQIAAILGQPRGARAVGMALGALRDDAAETVPWQRVVGAAGRCTHRDGFAAGIQQEMLEAEGVAFDGRGHLDLATVRWKGPPREWLTSLRGEI